MTLTGWSIGQSFLSRAITSQIELSRAKRSYQLVRPSEFHAMKGCFDPAIYRSAKAVELVDQPHEQIVELICPNLSEHCSAVRARIVVSYSCIPTRKADRVAD